MSISRISGGVFNFAHKVRDYTQPRPHTGADSTSASPVTAGFSGGVTGYIASHDPVGAIGGAVGGALGIKVGQKTESLSKAMTASVAGGALATAAAATTMTMIAGNAINPVGLAIFSALGGLSGLSGLMQGSCMGTVKDSSTAGLIFGSSIGAMTGNPLLSLTGSLAGATGGMIDNKALRVLTATAVGAGLGAVTGVLGGPAAIPINAVMGAITGALAATTGPTLGQVQRNLTDDLQKGILGKIKNFTNKLGNTGRTALGVLGGILSSAPLAVILGSLVNPAVGMAAVVGMGVLTGVKVNKLLKKQDVAKEYQEDVKQFLMKDFSKEEVEKTPPQVIMGLAMLFADKYKNKDEFAGISQEQFRQDVSEFQNKAIQAQPNQAKPQEEAQA